jgi:hypothetical protein
MSRSGEAVPRDGTHNALLRKIGRMNHTRY